MRKGEMPGGMTDYQLKTLIKMVVNIIKDMPDISTAVKAVEALLPEEDRG